MKQTSPTTPAAMPDRPNIIRLIIAAVIAAAMTGCSGRPSEVLSKEDMAQLMADIHMGESVAESANGLATDSARQAFLQAIYEKHGVTRAEVDSSFSWYGYNIEKYMEVYDRTIEILEQRLDKAQEIAGTSASGSVELTVDLQGDSVDVWPGVRWRRFSASMPNDYVTFSLSSDRNWEQGDVYTLRAKTIDNHSPATYTIAAEYSDGTTEYVSQQMPGDGWHELKMVLDSARSPIKVYGLLNLQPRSSEVSFIDSITLMRTRWGGHYRDFRNNVKRFSNRSKAKAGTPATLQRPDVQTRRPAGKDNPVLNVPLEKVNLTPAESNPQTGGTTRTTRPGKP